MLMMDLPSNHVNDASPPQPMLMMDLSSPMLMMDLSSPMLMMDLSSPMLMMDPPC